MHALKGHSNPIQLEQIGHYKHVHIPEERINFLTFQPSESITPLSNKIREGQAAPSLEIE